MMSASFISWIDHLYVNRRDYSKLRTLRYSGADSPRGFSSRTEGRVCGREVLRKLVFEKVVMTDMVDVNSVITKI